VCIFIKKIGKQLIIENYTFEINEINEKKKYYKLELMDNETMEKCTCV